LPGTLIVRTQRVSNMKTLNAVLQEFDAVPIKPDRLRCPVRVYHCTLVGNFVEARRTPNDECPFAYRLRFKVTAGRRKGRRIEDCLWFTPAHIQHTKGFLARLWLNSGADLRTPLHAECDLIVVRSFDPESGTRESVADIVNVRAVNF
jgi:hypothetical protein